MGVVSKTTESKTDSGETHESKSYDIKITRIYEAPVKAVWDGSTKYLDFIKSNRFVYTQQFCDEKENVSRHPSAPKWPETMLTTLTLSEESSEQTRVTLTWEPYGNVTIEEQQSFVKVKGGMTQGWTDSFDKLD
jgi:uncharacterized protein YndB with AHSA1/START domain